MRLRPIKSCAPCRAAGYLVLFLSGAPAAALESAESSEGKGQMKLAGYTQLTGAEIERQITNKALRAANRVPGDSVGGSVFCRGGLYSALVEAFQFEGRWAVRDDALCWKIEGDSRWLCRTLFSRGGGIYMSLEVPDPRHVWKMKVENAGAECQRSNGTRQR